MCVCELLAVEVVVAFEVTHGYWTTYLVPNRTGVRCDVGNGNDREVYVDDDGNSNDNDNSFGYIAFG